MFDQFPKTRPELPRKIEDIYSVHYKLNRQGETPASSLSQKMESWIHRQVAKDLNDDSHDVETLEIGAGTLNQLKYEPEVGPYDIIEPFMQLYEDSPYRGRIRNFYADTSEILEQNRYDRITSIATFEHICNLPEVVAYCGILLKQNGALRVSIPSEGTFLWTLGWKLTTGLEFRLKYGLDYGLLMKHEHVNIAKEIEEILRYFFNEVECKVFGIAKPISLYQYYTCRKPIIERCREYID